MIVNKELMLLKSELKVNKSKEEYLLLSTVDKLDGEILILSSKNLELLKLDTFQEYQFKLRIRDCGRYGIKIVIEDVLVGE